VSVARPAVDVRAVHKRFGSLHALRGVDLRIEQGEFFALLGPNGAGKTTLITLLAGLARPDEGTLAVLGHDVTRDYRAARRALGVVPQELVFDPFFTVRETLEIQSGYFGIRDNRVWIDELLEHLHLADKADANMRALSGGMKRRVLVAQALVHKPPVIVLDEPTAGVDVELRQTLWQFVRRLNREGHTILLTTHYLEEAEMLCRRVAMLKQGRIVALDTTQNLLRHVPGIHVGLSLGGASLPAELEPLVRERDGDRYGLALEDYATLERVLACLREAGIAPLDVEIGQADLEDAFVRIMREHQPDAQAAT
jgi:ABC-2 type transport system ATP-binding protein